MWSVLRLMLLIPRVEKANSQMEEEEAKHRATLEKLDDSMADHQRQLQHIEVLSLLDSFNQFANRF